MEKTHALWHGVMIASFLMKIGQILLKRSFNSEAMKLFMVGLWDENLTQDESLKDMGGRPSLP